MGIRDYIASKKSEFRTKQIFAHQDRIEEIKRIKEENKIKKQLKETKEKEAQSKKELRDLKLAPIKKGLQKLQSFNENREQRTNKSIFMQKTNKKKSIFD